MGETNKTVVTGRGPTPTSDVTGVTPTSDVTGVCWLRSDRSWEASWVEKGDKRRKHKYFSARKHGFDKAKVRRRPPITQISPSL